MDYKTWAFNCRFYLQKKKKNWSKFFFNFSLVTLKNYGRLDTWNPLFIFCFYIEKKLAVWVHLLGYLLRKRKQSLFLCLAVQAIVLLYFIRGIFTVSKTNIFRCFPNTLNITFTSQIFFICTLFSYNKFWKQLKMLFQNPWGMLNFCIFSKIKYKPSGWAINLGDEYQSFLMSIFLLFIACDEG